MTIWFSKIDNSGNVETKGTFERNVNGLKEFLIQTSDYPYANQHIKDAFDVLELHGQPLSKVIEVIAAIDFSDEDCPAEMDIFHFPELDDPVAYWNGLLDLMSVNPVGTDVYETFEDYTLILVRIAS